MTRTSVDCMMQVDLARKELAVIAAKVLGICVNRRLNRELPALNVSMLPGGFSRGGPGINPHRAQTVNKVKVIVSGNLLVGKGRQLHGIIPGAQNGADELAGKLPGTAVFLLTDPHFEQLTAEEMPGVSHKR